MLVSTDADFSDGKVFPSPYEELGRFSIGGIDFNTVRYDASLFDELLERGRQPPRLIAKLDEYVPAGDPHRLACDLGDRFDSIDVNPFVLRRRGGIALDGLVILRGDEN